MIDTHFHADQWLQCQWPQLSQQAAGLGMKAWVVPGVSPLGWPVLQQLAHDIKGVWLAPGVHPQAAADFGPAEERQLAALLRHPRVVALGEIGLDRQVDVASHVQEEVLRRQLNLALVYGKPVLIHGRRRTGRLLTILQEEGVAAVGGIWHAFNESLEVACQLTAMHVGLGMGPLITWPRARRLPENLPALPLDYLVLETDAPCMALGGRPQATGPANLLAVCEQAAAVLHMEPAELAGRTTANATRILNLSEGQAL